MHKEVILFLLSILLLLLSLSIKTENFDIKCYIYRNKTYVIIKKNEDIRINGVKYDLSSSTFVSLNKVYRNLNVEFEGKNLRIFCKNLS